MSMPSTACHAGRTRNTHVSQTHPVDTTAAAHTSRIRWSDSRPSRRVSAATATDSTASRAATHERVTGSC